MSLTRTLWSSSNTDLKFSETEINTHQTWIDGKAIYRKVINTGALPNATTKSVAHNIFNLNFLINLSGSAKSSTTNQITIPFVDAALATSNIGLYLNGSHIVIDSGATDRSSYLESYVIVEYTKT